MPLRMAARLESVHENENFMMGVPLPRPFEMDDFIAKAQGIAEQEEHHPVAFLFVDAADTENASFIIIRLGQIDKDDWASVIRGTAEKHNAKYLVMIAEGWFKAVPTDEDLPRGAVRDMVGHKDGLIVTYEGPTQRISWVAEIKNANAEKDRGVQPFRKLPGMDGNLSRILPIYDINKN